MKLENWKIELIKKEYPAGNLDDLCEKLGKIKLNTLRKHAVNLKVRRLKIDRKNKFPEWKADLIKEHYPKGDLDWLCSQTGQNRHALSEWARRNNIKREIVGNRNGNMEILIDGSLVSMYWLGFIAADGYIAKNGHLMISQHEKDKEQIYKLSSYLDTNVYIITKSNKNYSGENSIAYRVNICDNKIGVKIRNGMFQVPEHISKTYSGISLDFIKTKKQLAAFFCGFCCGDASFYQSSIRIEVHKNWYKVLEKLVNRLYPNQNCFNLKYTDGRNRTSDKYAFLSIYAKESRELKQFAIDNNLPINKRKWNKLKIN